MEFDDSYEDFELPFTPEELRRAFAVAMSPSDADEWARETWEAELLQRKQFAEYSEQLRNNPDEIARSGESPGFGWILSHDLLIILSLLSPELEVKVRDYLLRLNRGNAGALADWNKRREEIRPEVLQRLSELSE